MNIGKFSVKNKYLILTIIIGIVIFGFYARFTMSTQLSPDTNPPMATVITQYPGSAAQDVVTDVVEPMEDEFGKLEGIKNVKSTSQDNIAIIQLEFDYSRNIDEAAIEIQNSISRIRQSLPNQIMEPRVLKFSTADKPIMTISLNSKSLSMRDIRQLADDKIAYDLQLLEGVASVELFGGYNNEIQVKVDKDKLVAYGISLEQVSEILKQNNIKAPGGKVTHENKDILIRIEESFQTLDDIKKTMVPLNGGGFVYLEEIAAVDLSTEKLESSYRFNGEEAIALMITKKTNDNTETVIKNVEGELEELREKYPFIDFKVAQDDSTFTKQMVNNMSSSVFTAILLTVFVIILFITKINQSLVVSISMPLVFLATLGLMKLFGMKLDLVTLSALILSIGFVVDGAIVVVENIVRHQDVLGKDIVSAAIDGTNEIALPTIAGATTTLIVLVPLIFIKGFVGEMFRPLSMTIIFAILSSLIIALTIIPLLTVLLDPFRLPKVEKNISKVTNPFNKMMDKLLNLYLRLSKYVIGNKVKSYISIIVLMVLSGGFLITNGVEMLPKFDSGTTFISIEMEDGTDIKDTTETIKDIEKLLEKEKIL
ncbi:AcrB/AcrD/AcrF family protein [Desulfonispora thiosulfatigenes DSM 11270]|uniref:AcrB/AcrD/AcrF family protein n=1 Tax=Desulfonispora thiosulfatigenes DSM 11270 TaxID=656914 RepID=A0A1W1UE03_DESTI|nr:efflux RND transporter permease subunit [Desulfonispora thiosulfatigenes]SMB79014.1 AcrB/AcrD/AcrF family protein [Desulfonispora thiosulfatigenes DSM 11270]